MRRTDLVVVDASVALKWVLDDEEDVHAALQLRQDAIDGVFTMIAPSLWVMELMNGIVSAVRRTRVTASAGRGLLRLLFGSGVDVVEPEVNDVYATAVASKISAYDACYVALAKAVGAPLWTGDKRLVRATRNRARWIGEYAR